MKEVLWILTWPIELFFFFLKDVYKKIIQKISIITYIICLESQNFSKFQCCMKYDNRKATKPILLFSVKVCDRFNSLISIYKSYTLLFLQDSTFFLVLVSY